MTSCPHEHTLDEFADGVLDDDARRVLVEHAEHCARCARWLARLATMRSHVQALPREIAPPEALWSSIRRDIDRRSRRSMWQRPAMLAAAGIALVALTASGTILVMRTKEARAPVADVERVRPPAALRAVDDSHAAIVADLERTLAARRHTLAPETVDAVERSLRVIDSALAEARSALARDPASAALSDLVAAAYRQKLTLLQRATELAARS